MDRILCRLIQHTQVVLTHHIERITSTLEPWAGWENVSQIRQQQAARLISPHAFDGPPLLPHRSPGSPLDKGFLDVPERNGPGSPNQSVQPFYWNWKQKHNCTKGSNMRSQTDTHDKTPHLACCLKLAIYNLPASQFLHWVQHFLTHSTTNFSQQTWKPRKRLEPGSHWRKAEVPSQHRAVAATMSKGVLMMLLVATVILLCLPLVLPPLSPPPMFLLFVPVVMMLLLFSLVLFPSHHCAYSSSAFTQ